MHMFYYGPMGDYGNGWGIFAGVLWLIFFIFIGYVVIRVLRRYEKGSHNSNDPLDIIKERYAKGEITKADFEQLKKDLK